MINVISRGEIQGPSLREQSRHAIVIQSGIYPAAQREN